MMLYSNAMQQKALETHGGLYNSDPATSVSSGPFVLKEWRKGDRLIYEANPKYMGTNKPYIQKVVVIGAAPNTGFAAYQAGAESGLLRKPVLRKKVDFKEPYAVAFNVFGGTAVHVADAGVHAEYLRQQDRHNPAADIDDRRVEGQSKPLNPVE